MLAHAIARCLRRAGTVAGLAAYGSAALAGSVDVSVDVSSPVEAIASGEAASYTVVVTNEDATAATGTAVTVTLGPELTGATWAATFSGGATGAAAGAGNISEAVDLPVGGMVTYDIAATVRAFGQPHQAAERFAAAVATVMATGDINPANDRDADLDIVENKGPGALNFASTTLPGASTFGLSGGDVDGDALTDLAVTVFFGNGTSYGAVGDGTFAALGTLADGSQHSGNAFADVDNDGDLDLWQTNTSVDERLFINDGTGTFPVLDSLTFAVAGGNGNVALGDLDGDGFPDAAIAGSGSSASSVWLNDGTGNFTDSGQAIDPGTNTQGLSLGDIDGDGDLDLLLARYVDAGIAFTTWFNDGGGGFATAGPTFAGASGENGFGIVPGDLDGDGDLDLLMVGRFAPRVALNQGGVQGGTIGQFAAPVGYPVGGVTNSAARLVDIDGDDDLDAVLARTGSGPSILALNEGFGGGDPGFVNSGLVLNSQALDAAVGDFDGDGDFDFALGRYLSNPDQVLLNVPAIAVAGNAAPAMEGMTVDFTFTRDLTTDNPTVAFSVGGSATFNTDYTVTGATTFDAMGGTVAFPVGVDTVTVTLSLVDDGAAEPAENVTLTLTAPATLDHVLDAADNAEITIDASVPVELMKFSVD